MDNKDQIHYSEKLQSLILHHSELKKNVRIPDIYKLLYQANMGNFHILADPDSAYKILLEEYHSVNPLKDELLLENISTDNEIFRVNLRPFKKSGLPVDKLFNVMIETVKAVNPDKGKLVKDWKLFKEMVDENKLSFDWEEMNSFELEINKKDFPAVSHSDEYRKANNPSYRVVQVNIFQDILFEHL
ncbi:hypothetical protein ACFL4T_04635 [candidate division KSB1 bacterium]